MSTLTRNELKRQLLAEGFEVYRTFKDRIQLAERVRDNLIMDSGVSVGAAPLSVQFVVRAQRSNFGAEREDKLFERARAIAASFGRGYSEAGTQVVPIPDPGDESRTLDTWYEVAFEKEVESPAELFDELRRVLAFEKSAGATPD